MYYLCADTPLVGNELMAIPLLKDAEKILARAVKFERHCRDAYKLWPKDAHHRKTPLDGLSFVDRRIIRMGTLFSDRVEHYRKLGRAWRRLWLVILKEWPFSWLREVLEKNPRLVKLFLILSCIFFVVLGIEVIMDIIRRIVE